MRICTLDIGGSGVKWGGFSREDVRPNRGGISPRIAEAVSGAGQLRLDRPPRDLGVPDWNRFEDWLRRRIDPDAGTLLGIACAGFVDATSGTVRLSRSAGWADRPLRRTLEKQYPGVRVAVLNDAEAHLAAHADLFPHPQACLSLGTSIGFAVTDEDGRIVRPRRDSNFDVGELALATSASEKEAWWALGSPGLQELHNREGKDAGTRRYGHRLGAFLGTLCLIFQPRTVVLSGGITEAFWDAFYDPLLHDFSAAKPAWLGRPRIERSPYGRHAALWGMAKHVACSE